jgi:hypothetical protein
MKAKPNPICKRGQRNIYCPLYSDCLDHAVNQFWEHWSCSRCPFRKIKSFDEAEYGTDSDLLDYEFSPDIIRKIRGNESS